MDVTEILQFADQLVFNKKGKHLDDLQKTVITGVYEGKIYETIAEECHRSESRVRSVGRKLWKILSESLGEDINKYNFCWTIERVINNYQVVNFGDSNINYCQNSKESSEKKEENIADKFDQNLTLAPHIIKLYNRETELKKLNNWISNQNIRLISVLGLSGIGKTTLVKKFVNLNLEHFEIIIWRSLNFPKSLDLLINNLLNVCKQEEKATLDDKLEQLFGIFNNKKCLIILDDVQNIFIRGQLAGQYQPEYQDYQNFFTRIIETEHQSHVILISQEKCKEMECLDEELYPVKCLDLSGLDDVEIISNMGLKDEDSWLNLINLYEGNPFYIKTIANSIKNIFDGYVSEFLAETELILTKDMQTHLQLLFNRLSPLEQQIVLKFSNSEQPLSREALKTSLELSSTDLINSLQSLQQRYLVTKIKEDKILFKLSPVFREYVKNCCKDCS
jgi:NB-ARC domain